MSLLLLINQLNHIIMKAHRVYILRNTLGDCTNNGVTSRYDDIYLFNGGTAEEVYEYAENHNIPTEICFKVEVVWKGQPNEYHRAVPVFRNGKHWMAGGNFAYSCDSRYNEIAGIRYPISVHDRTETMEEYLSND